MLMLYFTCYQLSETKRPSKRLTPIMKRTEDLGIKLELTPVSFRDDVAYISPSKRKCHEIKQRVQNHATRRIIAPKSKAKIKHSINAQSLDAVYKRASRYQ
jgi:hypothetical protein